MTTDPITITITTRGASPNFLTDYDAGEHLRREVVLTDEHPASSYGIPVFASAGGVISREDVGSDAEKLIRQYALRIRPWASRAKREELAARLMDAIR